MTFKLGKEVVARDQEWPATGVLVDLAHGYASVEWQTDYVVETGIAVADLQLKEEYDLIEALSEAIEEYEEYAGAEYSEMDDIGGTLAEAAAHLVHYLKGNK